MSGLRRRDWRFLLDGEVEEDRQVATTGFPTRRRLQAARRRVGGDGVLVCRWRLPRPFGVQRALRRLRSAGFPRARAYWPGPSPAAPEFWLPVEVPAAVAFVLRSRPPASRAARLVRALWRLGLRVGAVAPVYVVAQPPGAGDGDGIPRPDAWLLLTPGNADVNKAIGLPFSLADRGAPAAIAKFARVDDAEQGIAWEARMLQRLERELPALDNLPRLRGTGRRGGRAALAQTYVAGRPLAGELTGNGFARHAPAVAQTLIELTRVPSDESPDERRERLLAEPLRRFEQRLGPTLPPPAASALRRRLEALRVPPPAFEHGDAKPWNVILTATGPALIDWEDADPRGLPGTDLAFFLASAALLADGAISSRGAPLEPMLACQRRLLDPATAIGAVAERCVAAYCEATGLSRAEYADLRLLGWLNRALHSGDESPGAGEPTNPFRRELFLALIEAELTAAPVA